MESDSTMWVIIAVVLVLLFFVVLIVGVGLTIFFISRKRKKAQAAAVVDNAAFAPASPAAEIAPVEAAPPASFEPQQQVYEAPVEVSNPVVEAPLPDAAQPEPLAESGSMDFDPSKTVAINREKTVTISYGTIKFTSGVLAGEQFEVKPEGAYIGRESSLSQIVVADPRISKRHLWIGVRDGAVTIVDQDSRNGTFLNDPKADRVTEATLNSGDTVILGESDVARFEYHS